MTSSANSIQSHTDQPRPNRSANDEQTLISVKSAGVQVATCSVTQLLQSGGLNLPGHEGQEALQGQLCIPEYQRPYRWQEKQIKRLIADIEEHFKPETKGLKEGGDEGNSTPIPYYLGSVILHKSGNTLNIIDGQQRITTLALLARQASKNLGRDLKYSAPVSQRQIMENLQWLKCNGDITWIKFDQLEFTLVITDSEDDAYAFFETQNTGGVRLSGPDIIKAHHLRAVPPGTTNDFARCWEAMGDLNTVIGALLRGRYWQGVEHRTLPLHNQPLQIRDQIVREFAELTKDGEDTAYALSARTLHPDGVVLVHRSDAGYALRQPLNSGANTIHYLQFFEKLRRRYLDGSYPGKKEGPTFGGFYHGVVCELPGCGYLKQLYDACLLMYISRFGEQHLYPAAVKIFRVVYSRRVGNRTTVREQSVAAFARDNPVLDWIALSYTPEQCFSYFDGFSLTVDPVGLEEGKRGVKKRFVFDVSKHFELGMDKVCNGVEAKEFGLEFTRKVLAL